MGPTPGTVLRSLILSDSSGSSCRELTRAYSVFWHRTIVSRLRRSNGPILMLFSTLYRSGFDQYVLNMFVALFRKRCPQNRVCGTLFFSAESAVADRLLDRPEARYVPHLERPGESGNGSDSGNGSEEFDPLR